jgi:hypothetical protein
MTEIHPGSQGRPMGSENGGFEREDLGAKPIIAFIVTVVVLGVVIYFGIWGMFHVLDKQLAKDDQSRSPLIQVQTDTRTIQDQQIKAFPEPRLEDNERTEINDTRYAEEERLNSAGWVDEKGAVAHIPIDRAMELIAQRGLPTQPQAGTAPASIVQTGRAAASKADTSGQKTKKGSKQ